MAKLILYRDDIRLRNVMSAHFLSNIPQIVKFLFCRHHEHGSLALLRNNRHATGQDVLVVFTKIVLFEVDTDAPAGELFCGNFIHPLLNIKQCVGMLDVKLP